MSFQKLPLIYVFHILLACILLETKFAMADDADVNLVTVLFCYGPKFSDHAEYNLSDAASLLKHPKFIHNQTHLYISGYKSFKGHPSTKLMAASYLKRNTTNFLDLKWEKLVNGDYISSQQNVLKYSPIVADFIIELFKLGLPEDSFSMSGSSMGACAIGVIARDLIERSNGTMQIERISLLDPSNEAAHDEFILPEIEKSFAKFIDVIHSDAGGIGTTKAIGHANFWLNNGTRFQPECPSDDPKYYKCSHRKATVIWAESVANGKLKPILAYPSGSYDELLKNGAEKYKDLAVAIGIDCPSSATGNYYLQHQTTFGNFYALFK
ncbi:phospholipase A1 member A-like [Episyrphus balteatus]|uniref:phospholipase A1 member A-like n=1 Tax=Episyrphus balteatus TaxID=286459 RepID=UPI0024866F39|nr:phospholipase A1 member A-like [Episyrphus balteatus]